MYQAAVTDATTTADMHGLKRGGAPVHSQWVFESNDVPGKIDKPEQRQPQQIQQPVYPQMFTTTFTRVC